MTAGARPASTRPASFALGSGVTLYTIGVEKGMTRRGKTELKRLAEETGGRAFLVDSVSELEEIYETIQKDLRSKYFLAYQPVPRRRSRVPDRRGRGLTAPAPRSGPYGDTFRGRASPPAKWLCRQRSPWFMPRPGEASFRKGRSSDQGRRPM